MELANLEYLVYQPKTLKLLATKELAVCIANQAERLLSVILKIHQQDPDRAEDLVSQQIEITRSHLESHLPGKLHDVLASETLVALKATWVRLHDGGVLIDIPPQSKVNAIGRMIEAVFTKNLTCLSLQTWTLSHAHMNMFISSFCTKSHLLRGLTQLCIKIRPTKEADVMQILNKLHNLKRLSLKYCSQKVIKCVAENCKLIEILELSNLMFDGSVEVLAQLPNLKSLCLIRPLINQQGMEMLLSSTKSIETKFTVSAHDLKIQNSLNPTLRYISFNEENAGKQFNIIFCDRLSETTLSQLKLVVKVCPQIQRICFKKYIDSLCYPIVLNRVR